MDPVTNYCEAILGENPDAMAAIRLIPELSNCSEELLKKIYAYSKTVDAKPGEILIQEGMFDQWVYFIIRGEMDVIINGKHLDTTSGPVVGERCILGEPRGADLVASTTGLMALGVELSIIDDLNRDINNFQQTASSDEEAETYANNRMAVALELFTIILNDVTSRILNLHDSGMIGAQHLNESNPSRTVKTRELYDFSEREQTDAPDTPTWEFLLYSFNDFSEVVYYEILQKHLSDIGYSDFPLEEWKARFTADAEGKVSVKEAFEWLQQNFNIPNVDLVDIASTIFEVASQYTATANRALNQVFSAFERDGDKKRALEAGNHNQTEANEQIIARIRKDLFDPMEAGRSSANTNTEPSGSGKMSQADIDALFG